MFSTESAVATPQLYRIVSLYIFKISTSLVVCVSIKISWTTNSTFIDHAVNKLTYLFEDSYHQIGKRTALIIWNLYSHRRLIHIHFRALARNSHKVTLNYCEYLTANRTLKYIRKLITCSMRNVFMICSKLWRVHG